MTVTVFTPTYNRAHILGTVYKSLYEQTCKDFEWLIIDDGSSDNTEDIITAFQSEQRILIRYFKKTNGGKHTAINLGVQKANGKLFWILDSDDSLPSNAVEKALFIWNMALDLCPGEPLGGICGYMSHHNNDVIGSPIIQKPQFVSPIEMRHRLKIKGDLIEIILTQVMREFPFPEIANERFCPEDVVLNRLSQKYKLYFTSDVLYHRDYLDGGLTDNIIKIRMNSPQGSMTCYSELFSYKIPFMQKVKAAINYWRFAFCAKERKIKICSWGNLLMPLGWLMHIKDLKNVSI